jgi:hypothetical protein
MCLILNAMNRDHLYNCNVFVIVILFCHHCPLLPITHSVMYTKVSTLSDLVSDSTILTCKNQIKIRELRTDIDSVPLQDLTAYTNIVTKIETMYICFPIVEHFMSSIHYCNAKTVILSVQSPSNVVLLLALVSSHVFSKMNINNLIFEMKHVILDNMVYNTDIGNCTWQEVQSNVLLYSVFYHPIMAIQIACLCNKGITSIKVKDLALPKGVDWSLFAMNITRLKFKKCVITNEHRLMFWNLPNIYYYAEESHDDCIHFDETLEKTLVQSKMQHVELDIACSNDFAYVFETLLCFNKVKKCVAFHVQYVLDTDCECVIQKVQEYIFTSVEKSNRVLTHVSYLCNYHNETSNNEAYHTLLVTLELK